MNDLHGDRPKSPARRRPRSHGSGSPGLRRPGSARAGRHGLLGRLAGGLAHDFNNVLTALEGHLDRAGEAAGNGPELAACLERARRCTERAAALTRRLLEVSRPDRFEPRRVELPEVVRSALATVRASLPPEFDLEAEIDPTVCPVHADPDQIVQALINLMLNAQLASPEGGRLSVRVAELELDRELLARHPWTRPGRYAQVEVRDSGRGIPYADQPHIFEPVGAPAGAAADPGFGMSVVYGIIKQHRGYINVESHPGEGTVFRVLLPAADTPAPRGDVAPRAAAAAPDAPPTVLLVEVEEMIRELAETALAGQGFRVLAASSASEAERLFDGDGPRIDLLLTDMVLPGRTGRELAESLRRRDEGLRVLYTTGYDTRGLPGHLAPEPGSHMLQKPYTLAELAGRVRQALGLD